MVYILAGGIKDSHEEHISSTDNSFLDLLQHAQPWSSFNLQQPFNKMPGFIKMMDHTGQPTAPIVSSD